jgi:hypothetical protein
MCSEHTGSFTAHWYIEDAVDEWWRNVGRVVVRNRIETSVAVATLSALYQCLVLKVAERGLPILKPSRQTSHVVLMECVWGGGRPDKYWPGRRVREGVWFNKGSYSESVSAPYCAIGLLRGGGGEVRLQCGVHGCRIKVNKLIATISVLVCFPDVERKHKLMMCNDMT